MIDAKTHIEYLHNQLKSGAVRPSVMKQMAKIAEKRGDHEVARRMNEAVGRHDQAVIKHGPDYATKEAKAKSPVQKLAKSLQTGPRGGTYYIGEGGEKVYSGK